MKSSAFFHRLAVLSCSVLLLSACSSSEEAAVPEEVQEGPQVFTSDDPIWGDEDAEQTLVIFDDFQCPFCAKLSKVLPALEKDWISTGKLKIQFRDYPLVRHKNALSAHRAAAAAGQQGQFRAMHDLLFEEQKVWASAVEGHLQDYYEEKALQLGLDLEQFRRDFDREDLEAEILADKRDGKELQIGGTPAVFVNGTHYKGALSIKAIIQLLEQHENNAS